MPRVSKEILKRRAYQRAIYANKVKNKKKVKAHAWSPAEIDVLHGKIRTLYAFLAARETI